MKIFVTVGTHEQGFPRLLGFVNEATKQFPNSEFFAQHGPHDGFPLLFRGEAFFQPEEMQKWFAWADCVVAQASPGILRAAIQEMAQVVLIPRRKSEGEAVDDHQLVFANYTMREGLARIANGKEELIAVLREIEEISFDAKEHEAFGLRTAMKSRGERFRLDIAEALRPDSILPEHSNWFSSRLVKRRTT